jgi:hypothetical protein
MNSPGDPKPPSSFHHRRVPRAIARKVVELSDGGLAVFEIVHVTGLPIQLVNLILRGGAPGVTK